MAKLTKSPDVNLVRRLVEFGDAAEARKAIETLQAAEMRRAAKLIENSAYELAGLHPGNVIGELIVIAADIERIAQTIAPDAAASPDPDT